MSPKIKKYKKTVSSLSVSELLAVLNNSRLSKDERFAVELADLYRKPIKVAADIMKIDERQFGRYLQKARIKIIKQIFE